MTTKETWAPPTLAEGCTLLCKRKPGHLCPGHGGHQTAGSNMVFQKGQTNLTLGVLHPHHPRPLQMLTKETWAPPTHLKAVQLLQVFNLHEPLPKSTKYIQIQNNSMFFDPIHWQKNIGWKSFMHFKHWETESHTTSSNYIEATCWKSKPSVSWERGHQTAGSDMVFPERGGNLTLVVLLPHHPRPSNDN